MDITESGDYEFQDDQNGEDSELHVEVIECWDPIKSGVQDFDIQAPGTQAISRVIHAGKIDTWMQVGDEKMRQRLAGRIMRLFEAWVFIGLITFIVTHNVWLLTTAGVLGLPLKVILDYYFRRSKR